MTSTPSFMTSTKSTALIHESGHVFEALYDMDEVSTIAVDNYDFDFYAKRNPVDELRKFAKFLSNQTFYFQTEVEVVAVDGCRDAERISAAVSSVYGSQTSEFPLSSLQCNSNFVSNLALEDSIFFTTGEDMYQVDEFISRMRQRAEAAHIGIPPDLDKELAAAVLTPGLRVQ